MNEKYYCFISAEGLYLYHAVACKRVYKITLCKTVIINVYTVAGQCSTLCIMDSLLRGMTNKMDAVGNKQDSGQIRGLTAQTAT